MIYVTGIKRIRPFRMDCKKYHNENERKLKETPERLSHEIQLRTATTTKGE